MSSSKKIEALGIIAGKGALPIEIAKFHRDRGGECYIVGLQGEVELESISDFLHKLVKIGEVGVAIDYFKQHNVTNIVFAGSVNRPSLKSIKVDLDGSKLLTKILSQKILGDDSVLKIAADFFVSRGFKVIPASDLLPKEEDKYITTLSPNQQDNIDIELGVKILTLLSDLDVGQAIVIEDGYVLGIEAAEGTDALIERCALLRKKNAGGILIKMKKQNQDSRMDIPTIGPDTINNLAKFKYRGIALQSKEIIVVKPEETFFLANHFGVFITKI